MLATLAGLAAAGWAFGRTGLGQVVAIAARLGVSGFLFFCLWSLATSVALGAAWLAVVPGERITRLPLFTWARVTRESVSDLLPLSQLGGLVVSARTVIGGGIAAPLVYASMLADLVTEMASQLVMTLLGLALMTTILTGASEIRPLVIGGTMTMIVVLGAFVLVQDRGLPLVGRIAQRLLPGSVATMAGIERERARIFASPPRIAASSLLNLAAWLMTIAGSWLVLRLIGVDFPFGSLLSLEVLIFTLRSAAFVIPGAIGVQEAGYALAGPLLGLPADVALALSLAKRARDVAIGLPALLIWQAQEARAVWRARLLVRKNLVER